MRFAAEEGGFDEELQKESCVVANRVSAVMAKRPVITPPAVMAAVSVRAPRRGNLRTLQRAEGTDACGCSRAIAVSLQADNPCRSQSPWRPDGQVLSPQASALREGRSTVRALAPEISRVGPEVNFGSASAESELLKRAKNGEVSSFGELSERCRARLMGVAYRILRNPFDAQDAVQDSLLRAFVNLGKFHEQSAFLTWATRITINSCLMRLRSRQTHLERYPDPGILGDKYLETAGVTPHPEGIVLRQEQEQLLKAAIDTLPKKLREVIELKELRELTLEEVASALGASVSATKARLHRAKGVLKKRLEVRRRSKNCTFEPPNTCAWSLASPFASSRQSVASDSE